MTQRDLDAGAAPRSTPRSGWIDALCLAAIVVVYRGMREELEAVLEAELFGRGFTALALRQITEGFRAEIPERGGIALAAVLVLGLAAWGVGRVLPAVPRGLPRPASTALRAAAAIALAVPLCFEAANAWQRAASGRAAWNVVLIVVDTLRADHLGLYGHDRGTSPNLDAFARESFVFENARATSSWTRPSIASILTSQTPFEHGIYSESRRHALADGTPTLQHVLGNHGYRSGAFLSSAHYRAGLDKGFDVIQIRNASAEKIYEQVLPAVEAWKDERFFLLVHNGDPHDAYGHKEGFSTRPASSKLRSPAKLLPQVKGRPFETDVPPQRLSPDEMAELKDNYDGEIRYLDHHLGLFLEGLERLGLRDETIVVITADHGEEFFEHGSWWHGGSLFDELLRVPLLLHVPGMGAGRIEEPVSGVDVLPTLADLIGVPVPETARGRSLLPLLRGEPIEPAPILFATGFRRSSVLRGAVVDGYKIIEASDGRVVGVYDLARDPGERQNLMADAALVARLRAALPSQIAPGGQARPMKLDARTRAGLEALGYVADPDAEAAP